MKKKKKSEAKSQRKDRNTLEEPWIVHIFHCMRKTLFSKDAAGKFNTYHVLVFVLATFYWTKSLICKDAF
jgi:hypothetical protein